MEDKNDRGKEKEIGRGGEFIFLYYLAGTDNDWKEDMMTMTQGK